MITTEDKRQWAAEEAVRLRECVDLIEAGEMVGEPLISRDAEIVEAIAQDYGRPGHVTAPAASQPTLLILIGAAALALSLVSAWQADRVIADWYYGEDVHE